MTGLDTSSDFENVQLVIVVGQAGAGMSTALGILADAGFRTVDNIPLALVDQLVALEVETEKQRLAITVDVRTTGFAVGALIQLVKNRRSQFGAGCQLVFLAADEGEILKRFQSTRRRHPLDIGGALEAAISKDRNLLASIADFADITIDTTGSAPNSFRAMLLTRLGITLSQSIPLTIISFSYRRGLPETADFIFDMRFVRNPHWSPELRSKTGQDAEVQAFISEDSKFTEFMLNLENLMQNVLKQFNADGKANMTIAFGCTGGKHRSVAAAEMFADQVSQNGLRFQLVHRELDNSL